MQSAKKGDLLLSLSKKSDKVAFAAHLGRGADGLVEARVMEKWITLEI